MRVEVKHDDLATKHIVPHRNTCLDQKRWAIVGYFVRKLFFEMRL
jgi:hypothetical protein